MLFYRHQVNGKRHCEDTRVTAAEDSILELSGRFCLHKRHRQKLMSYESLEGFQGGVQPLVTVFRGKVSLTKKGLSSN